MLCIQGTSPLHLSLQIDGWWAGSPTIKAILLEGFVGWLFEVILGFIRPGGRWKPIATILKKSRSIEVLNHAAGGQPQVFQDGCNIWVI